MLVAMPCTACAGLRGLGFVGRRNAQGGKHYQHEAQVVLRMTNRWRSVLINFAPPRFEGFPTKLSRRALDRQAALAQGPTRISNVLKEFHQQYARFHSRLIM